jgi:hypothetical protein
MGLIKVINMGFLGSKAAINAAAEKQKRTEEDKQFIRDNFEEDKICSANGTYCVKGCTYKEGGECQRLLNKRQKNEIK